MKSRTKIPITIKRITTTATIIPIISLLPVVFLKVMKYNIHTPAFINVWHLCISLFTNNMHVCLLNIGICISFVEKSSWCYMYCKWLLSKKKQITYFIVTQKIKINFSYNAYIQRIFFKKSPFNFQSFKDAITPSAILKHVHHFFYVILIR